MIHAMPQSSVANLARLAQKMLPDNVSCATGDPLCAGAELHPLEMEFAERMRASRRLEFTCGRAVARRAMAPLGHGAAPVLMARDRAPVWPENIVGSLSHTSTACIALAAPAQEYVSLGVDLEPDEPLEKNLIAEICNNDENRWLLRQPQDKRGQLARLVFSAKEAAYKAQYPLTKAVFGFDQMSVSFDFPKGEFRAKFVNAVGGFKKGQYLNGYFQIDGGVILTVIALTSCDWKG
jgi:4'-phosphopantetheinyl transferase EntD